MTVPTDSIIEVLRAKFSDIDFAPAPLMPRRAHQDEQMCIHVPAARVTEGMTFLRHDERCFFEQLLNIEHSQY